MHEKIVQWLENHKVLRFYLIIIVFIFITPIEIIRIVLRTIKISAKEFYQHLRASLKSSFREAIKAVIDEWKKIQKEKSVTGENEWE